MKPEWLTIKPASTEKYDDIKNTINSLGVYTVCVEAKCPNATDCWSSGTATFMVLGDLCTRGCRFCSVPKKATGTTIDSREPEKLALAISKWGLEYVVITSVCRDDLEDQGSGHFARCIEEIKKANPGIIVEVLIPDFEDNIECLKRIVYAKPDVVGHNIETVERLSSLVRDRRANYRQSLNVLKDAKKLNPNIYTKSAMMLGIGENDDEVSQAMRDLRANGVDFLALGQYLRPSRFQLEVSEYIKPEKFERFKQKAIEMGFLYAAAGPFVRSSYKAGEYFMKSAIKNKNRHGLSVEVPRI